MAQSSIEDDLAPAPALDAEQELAGDVVDSAVEEVADAEQEHAGDIMDEAVTVEAVIVEEVKVEAAAPTTTTPSTGKAPAERPDPQRPPQPRPRRRRGEMMEPTVIVRGKGTVADRSPSSPSGHGPLQKAEALFDLGPRCKKA